MKKKRILVVDDEVGLTRLLKLGLEQTGQYEVRVENWAGRSMAAAQEFKPDLILLDVMMPGLDGGDLASRFRSSSQFKHTPIVFLTAAVKEEVGSKGGVIGGFPYLAKPVDLAALKKCLEEHLEQEPPAHKPAPTP